MSEEVQQRGNRTMDYTQRDALRARCEDEDSDGYVKLEAELLLELLDEAEVADGQRIQLEEVYKALSSLRTQVQMVLKRESVLREVQAVIQKALIEALEDEHQHQFDYSNTLGVDICACGETRDWPEGMD